MVSPRSAFASRVVAQCPSRLVLPAPLRERLLQNIERDMHARLGPNEIQAYDVPGTSHAVWAWRFTDGMVDLCEGAFKVPLGVIQSLRHTVPSGYALVRVKGGLPHFHVAPLVLSPDGSIRDAIGMESAGSRPLVEIVCNFYDIPAWQPPAVTGSQTIHFPSTGGFNLGQPLYRVSSQHMSHSRTPFSDHPFDGMVAEFSTSYDTARIPPLATLDKAIQFSRTLGCTDNVHIVFIIGYITPQPAPGENPVAIEAWAPPDMFDTVKASEVIDVYRKRFYQKAEGTTLYSISSAVLQARTEIWTELFHERVENKLLVRVPLEEENGRGLVHLALLNEPVGGR